MAVAFEELTRGWDIESKDTNSTAGATRLLQIAGSDIEALYAELLGFEVVDGKGYKVGNPAVHPDFSWLNAVRIATTPTPASKTPDDPNNEYESVRALVTYEGVFLPITHTGGGDDNEQPEPEAGTFITHRHEFSQDIMTLPGYALLWADDNAQVAADIDAGKVIGMTTHNFTWNNVTNPPWAKIRELRGLVNVGDWLSMSTLTVLFMGATANPTFDAEGNQRWNLEYSFIEKTVTINGDPLSPYGWNYFYRAGKDPAWQIIINAVTGRPIYETTADFPSLFIQV